MLYSNSMASPSSSSSVQNSEPEGDVQQHIMEQRKRKRMLSNRESARRSRMRKQERMDDLIAQEGQLRKQSKQIISNMDITTQLYLNLEEHNAILRAQMTELSNRLQSLNGIIHYIKSSNYLFDDETQFNHCGFMNPWNTSNSLSENQPVMASADLMFW